MPIFARPDGGNHGDSNAMVNGSWCGVVIVLVANEFDTLLGFGRVSRHGNGSLR
ncbi:hypothetical protein [Rhodopirellula baltica]|uniref:hypothetical protein n=1 Tax=Rhodopirellula baltica TaxID=265606 RepID=UPI0003076197|nr:hypothetical protein [Rhodopirellula baltica]